MKKIDFEAHYYTRDFIEAISDSPVLPRFDTSSEWIYHGGDCTLPIKPILPGLLELGEKRVKDMDDAGVDKCMLSISVGIGQLEKDQAMALARSNHDQLAEVMARFPGRFGAYAVLPMHDVDAACAELQRCHDELGFFGWNAFSNFGNVRLDDPYCFPVLQKAAELNMPVYIHPTFPQIPDLHGYGPAMVTSGLGFAIDVTITLTRMIYAGIFDRLPNLKVIIGHLGECFPMVLRRMDDAARTQFVPNGATNLKNPSEYFKTNIWVSSSGNLLAPAFRCAMEVFGIEHIVLGTDYPMESFAANLDFIESLGLTPEQLERLYWKNAQEFFGVE